VRALEVEVGRDRLDEVLAVVEHAFDGDVVDVGVLQAVHLRLLERAHPAERREHEDLDAALALERVLGGAAGVARGRAEDCELRPRRASSCSKAWPRNCMATSLNASVGPFERPRTNTPGSSGRNGAIRASPPNTSAR
jgi:hypothetical protein